MRHARLHVTDGLRLSVDLDADRVRVVPAMSGLDTKSLSAIELDCTSGVAEAADSARNGNGVRARGVVAQSASRKRLARVECRKKRVSVH